MRRPFLPNCFYLLQSLLLPLQDWPFVETVSPDDDDDAAGPAVIADEVKYVSLNAIDFTDSSFSWSNPSTSAYALHLHDANVGDSMVEATLHRLHNNSDNVSEAPVNQVSGQLPVKEPPPEPLVDYYAPCAQVGTGASVTCANKLHALHDYKAYDDDFPCPVCLSATLDKSVKVFSLGEGFLHVPAINQQDFIAVCCFYSPHLTSTLISKNDIMKTAVDYKQNIWSKLTKVLHCRL